MLRFHNNDSNHCYWCKKNEQINSNITQYTIHSQRMRAYIENMNGLSRTKNKKYLMPWKKNDLKNGTFVVIAIYISILTDWKCIIKYIFVFAVCLQNQDLD